MRFVTWLALKWGRRGTRWLLYPISLYFLVFAPRARRASRTFLRRALEREAGVVDVLRNFHAFAATLHDRMYLLSGRFGELDIAIDGAPQLDAILALGRGCILLGSHLGSFEALRALGRLKRYPINIVMYAGTTQRSSAVLNDLAPELNASVIPPGRPETMLRIKECLERGEIVGILGDRPFGSNKTALCPFLGLPARFPEGPYRLAMILEVPIVVFFGLYKGGTRYRIFLEPCPRARLKRERRDRKRRCGLSATCGGSSTMPGPNPTTGSISTISGGRACVEGSGRVVARACRGARGAGDPLTVPELMQMLAGVESARASFVETRESALLKTPLVLKGTLSYRRPDRVEKHVLSPYDERIIVEGGQLTLENRAQNRRKTLAVGSAPAWRPGREHTRDAGRGSRLLTPSLRAPDRGKPGSVDPHAEAAGQPRR
jgi:predicted LPLAT superfamily acyltransferase